MSTAKRRTHSGVVVKHRRGCQRPDVQDPARCPCGPSFQASVWIARDNKQLRRNFPTLAAAKIWRIDQLAAVQNGQLRAPTSMTFREAVAEWQRRAASGAIRNRSGDQYKPSALRNYEQAFRLRLVPALGPHRLGDVARADLQRLVGEWQAEGLDPSTIRNTMNAARVVYRHADDLTAGAVTADPTVGLRLPAVRGRRDRVASPDEAATLLAALPAGDVALWATAFFAGLRHGELRALRWQDVNLAEGIIRVERSWDQVAGPVEPKSRAGRRRVPITPRLRDMLLDHKLETERGPEALVFGRSDTLPFQPNTVNARAMRAWGWKWREAKRNLAGVVVEKPRWVPAVAEPLAPITLHECRHTFASLMIAAGVDLKAISVYMGHASITITLDRYGHLLPGSEAGAAAQLDAFLDRSDTAARVAQLDQARG